MDEKINEMYYRGHLEHRHGPFFKRAVYSISLVVVVLVIGTLGFHYIEHYSYVESFYAISMLATGEGPASNPTTSLGLIFASVMAFVSVGSVIIALVFLFGPFFGRLLRIGEEKIEKEETVLKKDVKKLRKSGI